MNVATSTSAQTVSISWDDVQHDPAARAELLAQVRTKPGMEEKVPAFYDLVREIGTRKPEERAVLKTELEKMLGVSLADGEAPKAAPIGAPRPAPSFSAPPAAAPESEEVAALKDEIDALKQQVGPNAFLAGLSDKASATEKAYAAAVREVLSYSGGDVAELSALRDKIKEAVENMTSAPAPEATPAAQPVAATAPSPLTPIKDVPKGEPIARRLEVKQEEEETPAVRAVAPAPTPVADTAPVETPRWGSVAAAPAPKETPAPAMGQGDAYREPIEEVAMPAPVAAPLPKAEVPPAPEPAEEVPAPEPVVVPEPVAEAPEPAAEEAIPQEAPEPTPAPAAPEATLMTPEVTEGLEQLLHNWDIFKRSGFLGMGGNGIDHPLYAKLAPLAASAILAGSVKGVDKKVVANINEYVTGWKQEQGIAPEGDETFDTYLRRVIAHIIGTTKAA